MCTVTQYKHHPPIIYRLLITSHSSQVSAKIAAAVATNVFATGRSAGGGEAPKDILAACKAAMYFPKYWTHPPPTATATSSLFCAQAAWLHQCSATPVTPLTQAQTDRTWPFHFHPWLLRRETSPTYLLYIRQIPDLLRFVHSLSVSLHVPNHSTPSAFPSFLKKYKPVANVIFRHNDIYQYDITHLNTLNTAFPRELKKFGLPFSFFLFWTIYLW